MDEDPKRPPVPLGAVTTVTYDAVGLVFWRAPGRPGVQTLTYDAAGFAEAHGAGRPVAGTDPLGKVCIYVYDARMNIDPDRRSS